MKILLIIFVGIPGAGKTTLARSIVDNKELFNIHYIVHFNHDQLMPKRDLKETPRNQWKSDRHEVLRLVDNYLRNVQSTGAVNCSDVCEPPIVLQKGERLVLLIDDNMYYRSMRLSYFRLSQKYCCSYCQLYIDVSLDFALKANSTRPKEEKVPDSVIQNIFNRMDKPSNSNTWEKRTLVLSESISFENIIGALSEIISTSFENPENVKVVSAEATHSPNLNHTVDILIRKLVTKLVEEAKKYKPPLSLVGFTQALAKCKLKFMSEFKSGQVDLNPGIDLELYLEEKFSVYLEEFYELDS